MKEQFNNEFKGKVPGYEDLEEKLNFIESSIINNKKKIEMAQKDIKKNLLLNDNKLIKVKELNQNLV